MTISYAEKHAGTSFMFDRYGTAVTFSLESPGTYDETTRTWSAGSTTSVSGLAVSVSGAGERYKALVLVKAEVVTLLFRAGTYGEKPLPGYSVTWNGGVYSVDVVEPVAPDGNPILSRVLVSR